MKEVTLKERLQNLINEYQQKLLEQIDNNALAQQLSNEIQQLMGAIGVVRTLIKEQEEEDAKSESSES